MTANVKKGGGAVTTSVRVLRQHPNVTSIKRWKKSPAGAWVGDGVIKTKEQADGAYQVAAKIEDLDGVLIDWRWTANQPPGNAEDAVVEYAVFQDGKQIGFLRDTVKYPEDKLIVGKLSCELKVVP
jgi:hypothetical protein